MNVEPNYTTYSQQNLIYQQQQQQQQKLAAQQQQALALQKQAQAVAAQQLVAQQAQVLKAQQLAQQAKQLAQQQAQQAQQLQQQKQQQQAQKAQATVKSTSKSNQKSSQIYNGGHDDQNHDYIVRPGEEWAERYYIRQLIGKGSFGQVVEAFDKENKELVAIKIIKNREAFFKQAQNEINILERMNVMDKNDEYNVVKLKRYFKWKNHLCLVFELLSYNLYELLKNTKFCGVSLNLTRKFASQLCHSLTFIQREDINIIHCDLKPENILLVKNNKSLVKIVDFGSSCYAGEKIYQYIQSRFYRSPEVILGITYDNMIDMWSLGCILVEMHTGEPLFSGVDESDQINKIIEVLGMPPNHIMNKASSTKLKRFFVRDPTTSRWVPKVTARRYDPPGSRTLESILGIHNGGPKNSKHKGNKDHTLQEYLLFIDFIKKMLNYTASERVTPRFASGHAFLVAKSEAPSSSKMSNHTHIGHSMG